MRQQLFHTLKLQQFLQSQLQKLLAIHQVSIGFGREARVKLEQARKEIAKGLEVPHQGIVFTSGGSESNNAVLKQFLFDQEPCHIITSQTEHPSILATCQFLESQPHITVSYLPATSQGIIEPDTLQSAIVPQTKLISIMGVNNEIGTIQPVEKLIEIAQSFEIPFTYRQCAVSWQMFCSLEKCKLCNICGA